MIAVDSSAVVAIALKEPEAQIFAEMIGAEHCVIGWPTVFECHMALARVPRRRGLDVLDLLLTAPLIEIMPFDGPAYRLASTAFARFGKGRGHRAQLNFGDCMAYAVAKVHDVPLLYKGSDFDQTDIRPALP